MGDLKPRDDAPVKLEVKNVLDLVNGDDTASTGTALSDPLSSVTSMLPSIFGTKETTISSRTSVKNVPINTDVTAGRPLDDSLDQLLEDARRMQAEQDETNDGSMSSDEEGAGLKSVIVNTLSTIVTVDFFVVCGFLLWFLLGIFCSSILKNDSVQIALNNNF